MTEPEVIVEDQEYGDVIDILGGVSPLKEATIDINGVTGERVELNPLEKIKFAAERFGIALNDPQPSCKKCYGRGYTGIDTKTLIPVACKCITPKAMREASANASIPTNRSARRILERMDKKSKR